MGIITRQSQCYIFLYSCSYSLSNPYARYWTDYKMSVCVYVCNALIASKSLQSII